MGQMLGTAWRCRCPRCREGALFAGWPNRVLPQCPVCGLSYFREPGYFVGGMVVTYILAIAVLAVVSLVVFFLLPETGVLTENGKMVVWFVSAIALTVGFLRRSYSLWISLDYWIEPWEPKQR
jgi:uncharacterized protein (DUF983 family)